MLDNIDSKIQKVNLDDLILDPNNFRFVDHESYREVLDENKFGDPNVQNRTQKILLGADNENVKNLINSFLTKGYDEQEYIQVIPYLDGKYLVIMGNRRVATLKFLKQKLKTRGLNLEKLDKSYLEESKIPVVIYTKSYNQRISIFLELWDISKIKTWGAYNQAFFIIKLLEIEPYKSSPEIIGSELNYPNREVVLIVRTFSLISQFKKLGFVFMPKYYPFFFEILKSPNLKRWIEWDEFTFNIKNITNFERLVSYFIDDGQDIKDEDPDHVYNSGKLLINNPKDLHTLARFVENSRSREDFERTGKFPTEEDSITNSLALLKFYLVDLESSKDFLKLEDLHHIAIVTDRLSLLLKSKQFYLPILYKENDKKELYLFGENTSHFSEIKISKYKKFQNFELKNLNRINLFAGKNNAGKTTLLEAVLLLSNQTNYRAIFEITMKRAKHIESNTETFSLLIQSIPEFLEIEGKIHSKNTKIHYQSIKEEENGVISANRLKVFSEFGEDKQSTEVLIESFGAIKELATIGKNKKLLRSVYSSPFSASHSELVEACHTMSLNSFERNGERFIAKDRIIQFIKNYIDPKIRYIEMDQKNFKVTHEELETMFLWEYGEGLQRVFYIALLFAYAENGIVCIDEFENAVYFGLLKEFTKLVQELAIEFNVQVFLTTHSKECVDAFVLNEYRTEDISAYTLLPKKDGTITSRFYPGEELKKLIYNLDKDVRTLS
jgi:AAA15 family ATPase/GTPase